VFSLGGEFSHFSPKKKKKKKKISTHARGFWWAYLPNQSSFFHTIYLSANTLSKTD
jgi:hypothetical protein